MRIDGLGYYNDHLHARQLVHEQNQQYMHSSMSNLFTHFGYPPPPFTPYPPPYPYWRSYFPPSDTHMPGPSGYAGNDSEDED